MEGLLPYIYRAIVQHREIGGQENGLPLASPGESQRILLDSAYMRLPGDSGRFSSELMAEAILSSHNTKSNIPSSQISKKISSGNTHVRFPPSPVVLPQQLKGM
ncbi:hypothetical protein SUGI_0496010 [Cryptomeria japonica]|uniref:uncharacterized protein LOC131063214 n=1 Tax=Cryptomeria japonica TaxID=3369 RepID=UPI002408CEA2|nr:uncharacterized protein LOC131063214 [Cryptomeria japonica]GLJ25877.1 hypothetical protein SUGI_0496010 [Cryptomeria japonica]